MTQQQFEMLVNQYEKLVFTVCFQLVRDYGEAQNLTQDTFLSAYTHIDSCKPGLYKPWLTRIAVNKCKDFLKSAYHNRVSLTENDAEFDLGPPGSPAGPEAALLEKEGATTVRSAIEALKEPYRTPAILYFLEDRSVEEIASRLDRPPKTVQTQLYRAKTQLKEILAKEGTR